MTIRMRMMTKRRKRRLNPRRSRLSDVVACYLYSTYFHSLEFTSKKCLLRDRSTELIVACYIL